MFLPKTKGKRSGKIVPGLNKVPRHESVCVSGDTVPRIPNLGSFNPGERAIGIH
jgi:hypothetical protein